MNSDSPTPQAPALPAEAGEPRRISETDQPQFPCWLWIADGFFSSSAETNKWYRPAEFQFNRAVAHATHYLPDQPDAPTCMPETPWSAFAATVPDELALPTPPPTSTPDTEWAGTFDTLRKSLVECVAYLDRMGQDGVRERAYKALALPMPLIPDASAARTEADLWQRKYEQAVEEVGRLEKELNGTDSFNCGANGMVAMLDNENAKLREEVGRLRQTHLDCIDEQSAQAKIMNLQRARLAQLESALPGVVEALEAADELLQVTGTMRYVHDGKHDYLWMNLDNAASRYRAKTPFASSSAPLNVIKSLLPSNAPEKPSKGEGV